MTQTPPSYYSFHFLGLGQAGTIISAEGKCHQMELLHVFLIAEQTLIVRKTFKPSPPPPPECLLQAILCQKFVRSEKLLNF